MVNDAVLAFADLVVGILSHNDGATVPAVAAAVQQGVRRFDDDGVHVVWADSGSTDDTLVRAREAFAGSPLIEIPAFPTTADRLELPYHRIPAKARALHGILAAARTFEAGACVVIDAGVHTIRPEWIERLGGPILSHDFDFVLSHYGRPSHKGALTKGLVYPLVRALYGKRLRQPAAAEFACSARLLRHFLDEDLWESEAAQIGIDLWLTTSAASADFRLGEVALGPRSARADDGLDLATTVTQVVGSLFTDLEGRAQQWQRIRGSIPVQQFGQPLSTAGSEKASVDVERFIDSYRLGYRELRNIWTWVLPPRTIVELGSLVNRASPEFAFDDDLWARVVYDFAIGYRLRVLARDHLLRSLVPLYLGWLASFILQVRGCPSAVVDERVERLAVAFEAQKPYLIARWRWPERFRT